MENFLVHECTGTALKSGINPSNMGDFGPAGVLLATRTGMTVALDYARGQVLIDEARIASALPAPSWHVSRNAGSLGPNSD